MRCVLNVMCIKCLVMFREMMFREMMFREVMFREVMCMRGQKTRSAKTFTFKLNITVMRCDVVCATHSIQFQFQCI